MNSKDLQNRSKLIAERISESIHVLDHDPSMALYRLQEHVNKTLSQLVDRKHQIIDLNSSLQGACFDLDNAIQTLEQMNSCMPTFKNVQKKLIECLELKKQIDGKFSQSPQHSAK